MASQGIFSPTPVPDALCRTIGLRLGDTYASASKPQRATDGNLLGVQHFMSTTSVDNRLC
jgi:hypothetical protein